MHQTHKALGILGGTFDPIHLGHLRMAIELYESLDLMKVHLTPCFRPVHRKLPVASPEQRLAMVECAVDSEPALFADPREIARKVPSYTIDTLLDLHEELPQTPLCLLMGIDAFLGFPSWLSLLLADIAVLALGILLTFAFAPYEVFPFACLAPAGLLFFILHASPRRAFWLGFLFGLGLFGLGVYWIFISIHTIGEVPVSLSFITTSALVAFLALYPAFTCYAVTRYFPGNSTAKIVFAFPAMWVFSEWVRSRLFTGFPWLLIGYSQTNSPLKGYAPILSVYGVSLAVVLTSSLILNAILYLNQKKYRDAYFNMFAIVIIWTAGSLFNLIPWTKPVGAPISVSLVQGNIPQTIKWSPEHLALSFERYQELTAPLWGKNKLIIWPESAIPLPLQNSHDFIDAMNDKARETGSNLILGIPIQTKDARGYYNAVVSLGDKQNLYLKRQLVPFGEYTPLSNVFANLFKLLNVPMSDLVPGNISQAPMTVDNLNILTAVCYEIAYPELINTNNKNISLILTVTNDAWFGKSNAEAQHLQMAQMRAIELARPLLFVSNNGITAIINPSGQVEAAAPQYQSFVLSSSIQPMYGITPWMRNGTDPIAFILICLIATAVVQTAKAKKNELARKLNTKEESLGEL